MGSHALTIWIVGMAIMFIAWVWLVIVAFEEGEFLWGFACLLLPIPFAFIVLIVFWDKAKWAFFTLLIGAAVMYLGSVRSMPAPGQ